MVYFFPNQSQIDTIIKKASGIIRQSSGDRIDAFMRDLDGRIAEFRQALSSNDLSEYERQHIRSQFLRFAKTLLKCVESPNDGEKTISSYINSPSYYPVGVNEFIKPNPTLIKSAWFGLGLGSSLLLASLPVFAVNPIIAAVMLATAITILLPSIFVLLSPDTPDVIKKKTEEEVLFREAILLVDPKVTFQNSIELMSLDSNHASNSAILAQ